MVKIDVRFLSMYIIMYSLELDIKHTTIWIIKTVFMGVSYYPKTISVSILGTRLHRPLYMYPCYPCKIIPLFVFIIQIPSLEHISLGLVYIEIPIMV